MWKAKRKQIVPIVKNPFSPVGVGTSGTGILVESKKNIISCVCAISKTGLTMNPQSKMKN